MAAAQPTTATRSYRIYFRDAENVLARGHDVELASDEEARALAASMLAEQSKPIIHAQKFGTEHGWFIPGTAISGGLRRFGRVPTPSLPPIGGSV